MKTFLIFYTLAVAMVIAVTVWGGNPVTVTVNFVPPQTPTAVACSPSSISTFTTVTRGTLCTLSVTTSDGAAFPQSEISLTSNPGNRVALSGNNIVPASGHFVAGDAGTYTLTAQASENGVTQSQNIPLTVSTATSTPCTGSDSSYVPVNSSCVWHDEFTSLDSSKWQIGAAAYLTSDGATCPITNGAGNCSLYGILTVPDAPSYVEYQFRFNPAQVIHTTNQVWNLGPCPPAGNCRSNQYVYEFDLDMGQNCGYDGNPYGNGLCTTFTCWNPYNTHNACGSWPQGLPHIGPAIYNQSTPYVIGMHRIATPSPNGRIDVTLNGNLIYSFCDSGCLYTMENQALAFPSKLGSTDLDTMIWNLYSNPGATGSGTSSMRYMRVYQGG